MNISRNVLKPSCWPQSPCSQKNILNILPIYLDGQNRDVQFSAVKISRSDMNPHRKGSFPFILVWSAELLLSLLLEAGGSSECEFKFSKNNWTTNLIGCEVLLGVMREMKQDQCHLLHDGWNFYQQTGSVSASSYSWGPWCIEKRWLLK